MNSDSQSNPASQIKSPRKPAVNLVVFFVLSLVAAIAGYSIYVAVREPDPQETVILGQTKLAAGSPAGVRIVVRNRVSGKPVAGAKVEVALQGKANGTIRLGTFQTDSDGSLGESINIPEIPPGEYQLIVDAASSLGSDHVAKKIEVQNPARVLLSCDKPIYQPGQTIHLRSLALNGRTEKPLANEAVTFEVSDPKGNKVFKETRKTSTFGIASTDFVLATELNLGRYELRAMTGAATVERTVEIKRYALPKFKVQITTDKSYYLPGETVSGSIAADYFFGKPVGGGTVKLTAATFQEKPMVISDLNGRTDEAGKYSFHFILPDFFTGMPQKNEQAFLDLNAEVRDSAGHVEEKTLSLSVAQNALEVAVIPEAGVFVPGVENIVYVFTSYPDGRPANCSILANGVAHPGNGQGLCEIKITPADINQALDIQAVDSAGKKRALTYHSDTNHVPPAFLLRSDKAVYEAGQTAHISILSPEKNGTVFIDVIKDGQTVLTKSISLSNDKAQYALNLPSSLVGMLKLNAYIITEIGEDRGCSRVIFVNPASSLKIATSLSQTTYRPGQTAKMDFAVTDADGKPTPAALGIVAVDESVFALSENRPGLLKQFLDVESDLLKPRYQIKFFDSPSQLLDSENQKLATAYFASLEEQHTGPSLDDLVRDGSVPQRLIDNARSMRGTPAYERFRSDPQYAAIIRLLEGAQGIYSLREATGAVKVQSAEAHRQQYFKSLRRYLLIGFLTVLFLSPILLLIYFSRLGSGINREITANDPSLGRYVKTLGSLHNVLAVLTLLPMICYPIGMLVADGSRYDEYAGWVLLGIETIVVLLALSWQYLRLLNAPADTLKLDVLRLRTFLMAFLLQFILSRGAFICITQERDPEGFLALWFLMSIAAPLVLMGALGSHIKRQLEEKGITAKVGRATWIEVLVILSILCILAAMLLPALAKAKSRAMTVQLINDLKQIDLATQIAASDNATTAAGGLAAPRVRRDFPETLVWRPELITYEHGKASLEIPLADSITTWRASIDGVSAAGKMGNLETPITVLQDFFVDLDLPESMSLGDQVSVPVTCYNYLKEPQDVRFRLATGNWFKCPLEQLSVRLQPNEVKSVSFPIEVLRVGNHSLQVTAQGTKTADAIEREVRVVPTGERIEHMKNDVLKGVFSDTFTIPQQTIPDSQSLWLKFYPSRFSEVVEGLDSVFKAPYGCFEQTSSTTYPNVLVLDYMKQTGRLTPEVEIKARKYINAGYQRLLTFEVAGGGFEWFGRPPANICLTAYGVLEFTDMARVHPVDEAVTERARKWLFGQQNSDGSWSEIYRGWT
jgi:type II secretory pathway pseudopilin PulG/5-hydroxyisourate hydrolase-like protein (transthyretin family)